MCVCGREVGGSRRRGGRVPGGGGAGGARGPLPSIPRVTGRQRRGPARPPRAAAAGDPRRGRWPRPALARHPVQVPSASRRGGLKTLGGSPVRRGSWRRARGERPWGGAWPSPRLSPGLRPQAGGLRAAPRCGRAAAGRGSPAAGRTARARARAPRVVGGGNPRGACGGVQARSSGGRVWTGPLSANPSRPFPSRGSVVSSGRQEAPLGGCVPCPGRGRLPPSSLGGGGPRESKLVRLLAVDHSARASMKNAASCEN